MGSEMCIRDRNEAMTKQRKEKLLELLKQSSVAINGLSLIHI